MKGAVAAMLGAARQQGEGDWALALTFDEETGMRGAHRLADSGALSGAELVVVGEPTEMDLGIAHRGVLWLEVAVQGQAAHGSTPERGRSAIRDMLRLLQELDGFALPAKHGVVGGSSLNVGTLRGGEAVNMVAARCVAQLDLRIPPPMPTAQARAQLEAQLGKAGVPFAANVLAEHAPFEARPGLLLDRVRRWLRDAHPGARDVGLPYGTEASVYQREAPCVVCGPGRTARMHARDEGLAVAELRQAERFYASLLRAWG
jgi:acetylornithine deacetylase/succinyl-diaminopimelate desuccinylase-like protein